MKDSAPKELGILAVAALFGLVALVVAWAVLDYTGFASCLIGAIVAIITAIVLWFGWRDAAPGPTGPRDLSADAAKADATSSTTAPAAAASAVPAAAMAAPVASATPASTPAAKGSTSSAKASKAAAKAAKPAAKAAKPATKAAKPAAKAAKPAAAKAAKPAAAKAAKPAAKAAPAKAARPPVAADGKPETLSKPRAGGADDLKQIKGVGPGLEKTLNEMGFYHFDQIQNWRKKEIEWVDSRLKFKGRIVRDEWTKQAKTLAKGGTTEFSKKVKKGGVY